MVYRIPSGCQFVRGFDFCVDADIDGGSPLAIELTTCPQKGPDL